MLLIITFCISFVKDSICDKITKPKIRNWKMCLNSSMLLYNDTEYNFTSYALSTDNEYFNCRENNIFFAVFSVFFVITLISSVTGNTLVIACLMKFKILRQRNMYFLIGSLAFSDLLVTAIAPFEFLRVFYPATSKKKLCCLIYFAIVFTVLGSVAGNFLVISAERLIAVMHPLRHRTIVTRSRLKRVIAFVWIFSVLFALLPLFGWNRSPGLAYTATLPYCTNDAIQTKEYQELMVGICVIILIANCCMFIPVARVAFRSSNDLSKISQSGSSKRVTKLLVYTFTVFACCWIPFLGFTLTFIVFEGPICFRQWTIHVGLFHAALDWIIYGLGNRTFRKAFRHLILCHRKGRFILER